MNKLSVFNLYVIESDGDGYGWHVHLGTFTTSKDAELHAEANPKKKETTHPLIRFGIRNGRELDWPDMYSPYVIEEVLLTDVRPLEVDPDSLLYRHVTSRGRHDEK